MGGQGSGRKSKLQEAKDAGAILFRSAPDCALYLVRCVSGKVKRPSYARIDVAKYILDQVVGKARIKGEGGGGAPVSWTAIILLARQAEQGEDAAAHPLAPVGSSLLLSQASDPSNSGAVAKSEDPKTP